MTMCEATKRMKIMLDNEEKNPLSKAILILGETLDSSLTKIEETAQVTGKTLEAGKRLYLGLKKTGGTANLVGIEYIICFEDF